MQTGLCIINWINVTLQGKKFCESENLPVIQNKIDWQKCRVDAEIHQIIQIFGPLKAGKYYA